jgi:hypothetical protein
MAPNIKKSAPLPGNPNQPEPKIIDNQPAATLARRSATARGRLTLPTSSEPSKAKGEDGLEGLWLAAPDKAQGLGSPYRLG